MEFLENAVGHVDENYLYTGGKQIKLTEIECAKVHHERSIFWGTVRLLVAALVFAIAIFSISLYFLSSGFNRESLLLSFLMFGLAIYGGYRAIKSIQGNKYFYAKGKKGEVMKLQVHRSQWIDCELLVEELNERLNA